MDKKTRVAVIGVGYLGRVHANIYRQLDNVHLAGVFDTDEKRARSVAADLGCESFSSLESLLDNVDAASVVTPTNTHYDITQTLIKKAIHVLVEKPICESYEKSLELVQLAEKAGIIFQVGYLERYNAAVIELGKHIHQPQFIETHRLGMFVERAIDVDVVTDLMTHDIDIVLSLIQSPLKTISATGLSVLTEHIDIANARLEFENHAVANITASRVSSKIYRQMRLFEKNHYYSLNFENQQLTITSAEPQCRSNDDIVVEKPEVTPQLTLNAELSAFIHSVNTGKTPLVDGRTGLEAIRVANLICKKIHER